MTSMYPLPSKYKLYMKLHCYNTTSFISYTHTLNTFYKQTVGVKQDIYNVKNTTPTTPLIYFTTKLCFEKPYQYLIHMRIIMIVDIHK